MYGDFQSAVLYSMGMLPFCDCMVTLMFRLFGVICRMAEPDKKYVCHVMQAEHSGAEVHILHTLWLSLHVHVPIVVYFCSL